MIIQALVFYLFASITLAAGVMVISTRNPVHSVLFLILAFFNAAGLFVLMGAEFLAMILIVVYVGAVAVLFLFVVMMLDINFAEMRQGFLQYLPLGGLVGLILVVELVLVLGAWVVAPEATAGIPIQPLDQVSNTQALGEVISTRNPVHSVLFLILAFFNSAGLFVLMGAEFLAMILIVVYVGAVAVLFLFVVMMLDINFAEMRQGFLQYLPLGGLVGLILVVELVLVLGAWVVAPEATAGIPIQPLDQVSNTQALGEVIYTKYIYLFQTAGLVLLVAMIGSIVLSLRRREGVRRQKIHAQVTQDRDESIELKNVPSRSGV